MRVASAHNVSNILMMVGVGASKKLLTMTLITFYYIKCTGVNRKAYKISMNCCCIIINTEVNIVFELTLQWINKN
jgi:hypothetical protein